MADVDKIEAGWREYAENVLPAEVGEEQRITMKMAYFAGSLRMARLISEGFTKEEIIASHLKHLEDCRTGKL